MNRLRDAVAKAKPAFIPFIMAGDPSREETVQTMVELEQEGAAVIELGVPYSDPLADGPVIQRSAARALQNGVTMDDVFEIVKSARQNGVRVPLVLLTYINPVLQYGPERFFASLKESGGDGAIIPDLPFEESAECLALSRKYEIPLIPLVAPTSSHRIAKILENREGFVYCVSSLGVTGARGRFHDSIYAFLHTVRASTNLPICVGFGISKPEQIAQLNPHCDGFIVGSSLIQFLENGGKVKDFVRNLFPEQSLAK